MQQPVDFSQITIETPILENIAAEYQEINKQFNSAQNLNQRQTVIQQWDNLCRQLSTWGELTQLRFYQNTQNEAFKKALEYYNQLTPKLTELEIDFKRYLIKSPHRLELEQNLGQHIFSLWESDITTFESEKN